MACAKQTACATPCTVSGRRSKLVNVSINGATETFEIERKYEVSGDAELPEAASFAALGLRLGAPETHELSASYFDTPSGELASRRLALRNRHGGKDAGWHLKAKGDDGARELLWPQAPELPAGLRAEVEDRLGSGALDRLGTIATLRTTRVTLMLFSEGGDAVIEIADDRVDGTNELTGSRQQWREWEAELMPGADEALLDVIEPLLVAAGAVRARGTSKIQRTMQGGGGAA